MPPRKKATSEDASAATEPERRSTRIREAPPKPAPVAPAAKPEKKVKKTDPALEEYRPSGAKKTANKKRKKADVEKEDGGAEGAGDGAAEEESKPKKKAKTETKTVTAAKEKKTDEAKTSAAARTERRRSGVVNVQPTIDEDAEGKAEEVALVVGALLPQMKVKNEKGEEVEVSTLAAETGVVIFTAPKADTPGCNKQACHFRDTTAEFTKLGYTVYGLTADTPAALTKWQTKNTLGYSLLSDPKRDFIKALGAKSSNSTKRSHFVFEKGTGKLLDVKLGVKPDDSHAAALAFIRSL